MKIVTSNKKTTLKLSKSEWQAIGLNYGWIKKAQTCNYESLSKALDAVEQYLAETNSTLDPEENESVNEPYMYGGISYETTKEAHYKLSTYKGKKTKKYLHVSIYRTDNGLYELTRYIN